ncbi:MAG: hypothetical protein LC800_03970 [Acidobacteria bacterium]|nr:hypothetical protein [Acidobacteriota bacterium]
MKTINLAGLVVLLSAMLTASLRAQDAAAPRAAKVDEFAASVNCEDVLARLDYFFVTLQNDPSATGLIAVYGKGARGAMAGGHTLTILSRLELGRFEPGRIDLVRGEADGESRIEFWLVPAGAAPPASDGTRWSYGLPRQAKPFLLGTEFSDGVGGCGGDSPFLYAAFLKANPGMRGNMVIGASSAAAYRRRAREKLDELAEMGVARKRLKTFFVRVKPNLLRESVEYWLLP